MSPSARSIRPRAGGHRQPGAGGWSAPCGARPNSGSVLVGQRALASKRCRSDRMDDAVGGFIRAGTLDELRDRGRVVVGTPGGAVLIVAEGGDVVALDNRCPHMGFPLHRGSIEDGILTCHWHHARFDLRSGSTFDLWADDVPT